MIAAHMSYTIYEKHEKIIYRSDAVEYFENQCLAMYKSIYTANTFWLTVAVDDFKFYYPVEGGFDTEPYTLIELFQIINSVLKRPTHERLDTLLIECATKAILDSLTALQPRIASAECLKFLLEDAEQFTPIMRTHYAPF